MEKTIYRKENGEVRVINLDTKTIGVIKKQCVSPCFTCDKGYPSKCDKMAGRMLNNIDKYDFITDGFTIMGSDGQIEDFLIERCVNYVPDAPRKKANTLEEIKELNRLKESIKMHYFDAESVEEANKVESYLITHNLLTDPDNPYTDSSVYSKIYR